MAFNLGSVRATPGAYEAIPADAIYEALQRHSSCDWGEVDAEDSAANDDALENGGRLLSAYIGGGVRFWIITEGEDDDGQREGTTVLLPSEY